MTPRSRMAATLLSGVFALMASNAVHAQGEAPKSWLADLDGDGVDERIEARFTGRNDQGKFYHLVVLDKDGEALWTGPKAMDEENPLVFGEWHYGISMPQAVGDVDADEKVELIAPAPQSDVSPTAFRVLRWDGKGFKPVRVAQLLETPRDSDRFPWAETEEYEGRWISAFESIEPGNTATVEITEYRSGATGKQGVAMVGLDAKGMGLRKWLKPLKAVGGEEPEPEKPADAGKPSGGKVLATYMCQLGPEDMRSSTGERLTSLRDVLAQDRANYHRFKIRHRRDMQDEDYFSTPERRQHFSKVPVNVSKRALELINQGNATVVVTAYPDRVDVRIDGE